MFGVKDQSKIVRHVEQGCQLTFNKPVSSGQCSCLISTDGIQVVGSTREAGRYMLDDAARERKSCPTKPSKQKIRQLGVGRHKREIAETGRSKGELAAIPRFDVLYAVLREDSLDGFLPSLRVRSFGEDVSEGLVGSNNHAGG